MYNWTSDHRRIVEWSTTFNVTVEKLPKSNIIYVSINEGQLKAYYATFRTVTTSKNYTVFNLIKLTNDNLFKYKSLTIILQRNLVIRGQWEYIKVGSGYMYFMMKRPKKKSLNDLVWRYSKMLKCLWAAVIAMFINMQWRWLR